MALWRRRPAAARGAWQVAEAPYLRARFRAARYKLYAVFGFMNGRTAEISRLVSRVPAAAALPGR